MAIDPTLSVRGEILDAIRTAATSPDQAVREAAQDAIVALNPNLARLQALRALFQGGTVAEKVRAVRIATLLLLHTAGGT